LAPGLRAIGARHYMPKKGIAADTPILDGLPTFPYKTVEELPVIRPELRILFVSKIGAYINYMGNHSLRYFSIPAVFCIHFCGVGSGPLPDVDIEASLLFRLLSNTAKRSA
jgi:hypothetical protein